MKSENAKKETGNEATPDHPAAHVWRQTGDCEMQDDMTRVRSLEGREAGIVARILQRLFRLNFGRELNPSKVQAHSTRVMLASFFSNAILQSGKWEVGMEMAELMRIRVAALNGCPF